MLALCFAVFHFSRHTHIPQLSPLKAIHFSFTSPAGDVTVLDDKLTVFEGTSVILEGFGNRVVFVSSRPVLESQLLHNCVCRESLSSLFPNTPNFNTTQTHITCLGSSEGEMRCVSDNNCRSIEEFSRGQACRESSTRMCGKCIEWKEESKVLKISHATVEDSGTYRVTVIDMSGAVAERSLELLVIPLSVTYTTRPEGFDVIISTPTPVQQTKLPFRIVSATVNGYTFQRASSIDSVALDTTLHLTSGIKLSFEKHSNLSANPIPTILISETISGKANVFPIDMEYHRSKFSSGTWNTLQKFVRFLSPASATDAPPKMFDLEALTASEPTVQTVFEGESVRISFRAIPDPQNILFQHVYRSDIDRFIESDNCTCVHRPSGLLSTGCFFSMTGTFSCSTTCSTVQTCIGEAAVSFRQVGDKNIPEILISSAHVEDAGTYRMFDTTSMKMLGQIDLNVISFVVDTFDVPDSSSITPNNDRVVCVAVLTPLIRDNTCAAGFIVESSTTKTLNVTRYPSTTIDSIRLFPEQNWHGWLTCQPQAKTVTNVAITFCEAHKVLELASTQSRIGKDIPEEVRWTIRAQSLPLATKMLNRDKPIQAIVSQASGASRDLEELSRFPMVSDDLCNSVDPSFHVYLSHEKYTVAEIQSLCQVAYAHAAYLPFENFETKEVVFGGLRIKLRGAQADTPDPDHALCTEMCCIYVTEPVSSKVLPKYIYTANAPSVLLANWEQAGKPYPYPYPAVILDVI
eukprot:c9601_g1_i2.p1 GENE.c9601_g1_i2~~c9601_g1_i2.p1  ORF type:complete len:764 (-),score=203.28 c9601_g1_i2:988-3225(-)